MAQPTKSSDFFKNLRIIAGGIRKGVEVKDKMVADKKRQILADLNKFQKEDYIGRITYLKEEKNGNIYLRTDYKIRKESGEAGKIVYIENYFNEVETYLTKLISLYKKNTSSAKEREGHAEQSKEPMIIRHPYEIETSKIFMQLSDCAWKNYDKVFIQEDVQRALRDILYYKKVISYEYDGTPQTKEQIDAYTKSYVSNSQNSSDMTAFPILSHYVGGKKNGYPYIVCMDEYCVVSPKDNYKCFCVLFAMQLSLTQIIECEAFLNYHLKSNFGNNWIEYENFLDALCREYDFLAKKHSLFIHERYLLKRPPEPADSNTSGLEKYENDTKNYTYDRLKAIYDKRLENARDKVLAHNKVQESLKRIYPYLKHKYGLNDWVLMNKIDELYRENKNGKFKTYDAVLIHCIKNDTPGERKEVIRGMAILKAYYNFSGFLLGGIWSPKKEANETHTTFHYKEPMAEQETANKKLMFSDFFKNKPAYKKIMDLFVAKAYCQPKTYIWKDDKKGSKGFLAAILKHLHTQGYYKENKRLSIEQIKEVAKDTFGQDISIDTIKRASPERYDFSFISPASSVN